MAYNSEQIKASIRCKACSIVIYYTNTQFIIQLLAQDV